MTVCIKADEYYAKDDPAAKERFLNCADWLVEHAVAHKGYSLLEYDFPYSRYGMTAPWRSALANGMALTALTRAHARTGSLRYLTTARALMAAFHVPEDEGGFAVAMPQGVWYEEYADEGGTRPRVLNGMIFALFGLHDIYSYLGDRDAKRLFEDGVAAVKAELPRYDNRGHSYYDLLGNDPGPYHAIHVEQLAKLYALTNEPVFKQYHDRWAAYREPTYVTRLLTRPTPLRVAVAGVNAAAIWLLMLGLWALRRRR
ncbi:MAG: hypothetical protein BWY76_02812 [bacterium ADurb.Bin429]|nr:MAG: hypothetical protein BWY76_02812 [bacterium ADurb.Bin429]